MVSNDLLAFCVYSLLLAWLAIVPQVVSVVTKEIVLHGLIAVLHYVSAYLAGVVLEEGGLVSRLT